MFNYKVFVAEFVGTFALVFIGAAAGIYSTVSTLGVGLLGVALAHGLTVAAFIYAFGHISGMHINPAVTLGLAINGTIKWVETIVYWVAQFSGAVLAAFLLKTFVSLVNPDLVASMANNGVLTAEHMYYAMTVEALVTFFLVNAVLHAAVDGKAGQLAGLAIGLTLAVGILASGPLTGGSLNPARSFGPAVFTSTIDSTKPDYQNYIFYLIYFAGPFIGSIVAVLLYKLFKYDPAISEDMDDLEFVEEVIVEEPVKQPARKSAARKSTKK